MLYMSRALESLNGPILRKGREIKIARKEENRKVTIFKLKIHLQGSQNLIPFGIT